MPRKDIRVSSHHDVRIEEGRDVGHERIDTQVRPHVDGGPSGGSAQSLTLICPSTGEPLAVVSCAGPDDMVQAVESAARCSKMWRAAPFRERAQRLGRLAALIHEQRHAIARLIAREQGKPYLEALSLEVIPALDHLRFVARHAERFHSGLAVEPRHPFYAHKHASFLHDPIGVVALITPSPLPFAAPLIQVAAALAMGNAVVLKPSERAPLSGLSVGRLCTEAGFPAGLVNVVPAVPENTMHLVLHDKVDKVFVTGSLEAGQSIMAMAGCAVRPVVLCLAGNHPSVVAADAELRRAAKGVVWGALANCGQNCGSVQRVFVVEQAASLFVEYLLQEVDSITTGDPLEAGVDLGPLHTPERRESVHRAVTEAVNGGARIVRGGTIPAAPGYFYPPTVLLDPPLDCRLMREETPGPVIPIVMTRNLERALMLANDTDYALTASGWTTGTQTAERMMDGLHAGVVTINDVLYSYGEPASTWSGYRKSGMGQIHGVPGLREMSRQRFVSYDPVGNEAPLFAFPYDASGRDLVEASCDFLNRSGLFRKLLAFSRLIRIPRFRRRATLRGILGAGRRQV